MCMSISAVTCSQPNIQKPAFKGKWSDHIASNDARKHA